MRNNFGYNGSSTAGKELIETINELVNRVRALEAMKVDMGANGGTDIVRTVRQLGKRSVKLDFSQVYLRPEIDP